MVPLLLLLMVVITCTGIMLLVTHIAERQCKRQNDAWLKQQAAKVHTPKTTKAPPPAPTATIAVLGRTMPMYRVTAKTDARGFVTGLTMQKTNYNFLNNN